MELSAEQKKSMTDCEAEIAAALKRHGCKLVYDEHLRNGHVVKKEIVVVKAEG